MKLCFGTLANVLILCAEQGVTKIKMLDALVQSVDHDCKLTNQAVTPLLQCTGNLPGSGRANELGDVIGKAKTTGPKTVAGYFSKRVITSLIDSNKRKLVVLALRAIIADDESILDDDAVELVNGTTKKALQKQSQFVLSDFLAGVFLYTTQANNKIGKKYAEEITEDFVQSFAPLAETINFNVHRGGESIADSSSELFNAYLQSAKEKYGSVKTLLYNDEPKPFYKFYVPSHITHSVGRAKHDVLEDVTAETLTSLSNFIIIEGIGGLGKSMMMRHLLLNAVDTLKQTKRVPVLIPLKDYCDAANGLHEFVYDKIHDLNENVTKEAYTFALNDGAFLLLFDGLDEIDTECVTRFEREIEKFTDQHSNNCFVISSRPFQSFVSFGRFCTVKLQPFTKKQALQFVDMSDFRADQPKIKDKFREKLDSTLFNTHRTFTQNPLLLTIMLLTFEQFAEIPSKMHIFYREAFIALTVNHDATKGAFKRELRTGLSIDAVSDYFAELCFRSYRDEKYELTEREFSEYFAKLAKSGGNTLASDLLHDLVHNLCLMYFESGRYHFVHRSFQEYFAALFMSKQNDTFIGRLGAFFEKRSARTFSNTAFPMLYDIIPDKAEQFIFVPYLSELLGKCEKADGYWTFLKEMYPIIYYTRDEVEAFTENAPGLYVFDFILRRIRVKPKIHVADLPFYNSLVTEEVYEDTAPLMVEQKDKDGNVISQQIISWPYGIDDEGEVPPEPEIIGWKLEFDVEDILNDREEFADLLSALDNDEFEFKAQFFGAKVYFERLKGKIQSRQDSLNDLL